MSRFNPSAIISDLSAPADHFEDVTPSDTIDLAIPSRALYVGGAGTVVAVAIDDSIGTFVVPAGGYIIGRIKRVNRTDTTATDIVSLS